MGVKIVGVSYGEPDKTRAWVEQEKFGFEVWTDSDRTLAGAVGAVGALPFPKRITAIVDAEGKAVVRYPEVSVGTHPPDVLEDVKALFGG